MEDPKKAKFFYDRFLRYVCPHCGVKNRNSFGFFVDLEGTVCECHKCGKKLMLSNVK